jgi:isoquinoline 1-oxidoreductase beta subunit
VSAAVPLSRRVFLQASAAAGGGLILTGILGAEELGIGASPTGSAGARAVPLNAWMRITTDDQVTLICSQSEMGQGIMTTLPAVLAEELGADWKRVKVEISPVATVYRNPRINWMFTGNSESTMAFFDLLLQMGASAREMLIAAAAKRWGVPARECRAETGRILHGPSARALTFGALAEAAARETPPEKPTLKAQKDWTLLGRSLPRVELPAKLDGSAVFGLDVRVPGMLYAAVKQSPVFGGQVKTFDKQAALRLPGVVDVVPIPSGVAVVAKTYWEAARALRVLPVTFDDGPSASLTSESLMAQYRAALEAGPWLTVLAEGAYKDAEHPIAAPAAGGYSAEYESQFLAHATMEPMNCTAHVTEDACQIWGPLQGPELAQIVAAQVTGLPQEKITINRTLLGGGFGRRLLVDFVVQAVLVSKAVGAPVKVIWSREEDMQHDVYRPATLQTVTAEVDRSGLPRSIAHRLVSPSILQFVFPPAVTETNDPSCLEGLMESHYEIPNVKVDFHLLKVGVPTSVLRTTGFGPNIFAVENFIDELAHRAHQDPYTFRRLMLKDERALAVLDLAASKAGWTAPLPPGRGRGIAYAEAFRTHVAHVVELSVEDERVTLHRVVCVIDCGTALDPEISRSSLEGGTVWGIGAAFKSAISFRDGRTVERNFDGFRIPQISETPAIEVHIIDSGARPLGGTGEVGPVTLVPAVTNAIFVATGRRLRSLPLSRHGLRLA